LEWTLNDTYSITAGGFKNSDNQHSDYVGMYVLPWRWQNFKAGAVVGAFDGYPRANQGGWFPALIPVVSWEGAQWGLQHSHHSHCKRQAIRWHQLSSEIQTDTLKPCPPKPARADNGFNQQVHWGWLPRAACSSFAQDTSSNLPPHVPYLV
jgi:hypothetical protein